MLHLTTVAAKCAVFMTISIVEIPVTHAAFAATTKLSAGNASQANEAVDATL